MTGVNQNRIGAGMRASEGCGLPPVGTDGALHPAVSLLPVLPAHDYSLPGAVAP